MINRAALRDTSLVRAAATESSQPVMAEKIAAAARMAPRIEVRIARARATTPRVLFRFLNMADSPFA